MTDQEWQRLSSLARRFYLEDASKTQLAEEFALSRFQIARQLRRARELGVVSIEIHDRGEYREELSVQLAEHLGLDECVVVRGLDDEDENRRRLARVAATRIRTEVHEGDLLGLTWGRTIAAVGEELAELPPCTIIQLTGTVGSDFRQSPVEVIRRIAGRSDVDAVAVFAPLFAATEEAAATFRGDPAIRGALDRYDHLAQAVVAIGSWDPPITQLRPLLTDDDLAELDREGARAEIAGIFLRDDGSVIDAAASRRRISVSVDQVLGTRWVLAVAAAAERAPAIAAAARSGLLTALVTDDRTALALRALPAVDRPARDRTAR